MSARGEDRGVAGKIRNDCDAGHVLAPSSLSLRSQTCGCRSSRLFRLFPCVASVCARSRAVGCGFAQKRSLIPNFVGGLKPGISAQSKLQAKLPSSETRESCKHENMICFCRGVGRSKSFFVGSFSHVAVGGKADTKHTEERT